MTRLTLREAAWVWVALIILAAVAALAWRTVDSAADTLGWVEHTHSVLQQLDEVTAAYSRAASARRAYVVAGDESQLGELAELDGRLEHVLKAVRLSLADNPGQLERLGAMADLLHERLKDLDLASARRRLDGVGQETAAGFELSARIREAREALEAEENRLLADRDARTRRDLGRTKAAELLGSLTSFTILFFAFRRLRHEVTLRGRSEAALKTAKEATEVANRELEAFSYSVAHDLRAPLRGMNGFAELLLETYQGKLDEEGRDWLREIVLNAKKMGGLIDALLSLAHVTRAELNPERVDLSSIARELAAQIRASEPLRRVDLRVQDDLSAEVDSRLACVVTENLMRNAWKFTGHLPEATIEFGAVTRNGETAFFIRDNGAGFDMAYAGKLFTPFQRLHGAKEFPGTGIGLATVQRIVHRHGGRVWAEGAVNAGATFYFTLPDRESRRQS